MANLIPLWMGTTALDTGLTLSKVFHRPPTGLAYVSIGGGTHPFPIQRRSLVPVTGTGVIQWSYFTILKLSV